MTQTGEAEVDEVDEVVRMIDGLDTRPVADHVAAFEEAHRRLRHVLDAD